VLHLCSFLLQLPEVGNPGVEICRKLIPILNCTLWSVFHSFTTGPKPLPKSALHIVWSRASSFKWEYPLLSLRSLNSFLRLLPRLPFTSIYPSIFPSVTRCRRQFLRKLWPIQFAFRLRISCRIFLCSLTLNNTSSFLTWSVQLILIILFIYCWIYWPLHNHIVRHSIRIGKYVKFCSGRNMKACG